MAQEAVSGKTWSQQDVNFEGRRLRPVEAPPPSLLSRPPPLLLSRGGQGGRRRRRGHVALRSEGASPLAAAPLPVAPAAPPLSSLHDCAPPPPRQRAQRGQRACSGVEVVLSLDSVEPLTVAGVCGYIIVRELSPCGVVCVEWVVALFLHTSL